MEDWRSQRDAALLVLERSKRSYERVQAALAVVELAHADRRRAPELTELIARLLADKDPGVRRQAVALAALTLPPAEAESLLGAQLKDLNEQVRLEATGQLADLARPTCRAALAVALEDSDFLVRFEAARGMAALEHRAGLDVLIEGLEHRDLRFRALGALAQLGDARALPAIQRVFDRWLLPYFEKTQAAGALVKLGDVRGATHLLERTRKAWSVDRALAIELCGEVRVPGAEQRLLEILQDPKDSCRGAAARGLGRLGSPSALEPLTRALGEPGTSDEFRLDVAEGLCRLNVPEARERVAKAMDTFRSAEARIELQGMLEELA